METGGTGSCRRRRQPRPALSLLLLSVTGKTRRNAFVKKETVGTLTSRIAQLEAQEKQLVLLAHFPPPGCRNVVVWQQVQTNKLCVLRKRMCEDRSKLARITSQLEFNWDVSP